MADCRIINIEAGRPTVADARACLSQGLRNAKAMRYQAAKIIHGYGSSGKGGAIKADVQRTLQQMRASGQVRAYVRGEDFSPFDPSARMIVERCPQMARDCDYNRQNEGVTIVLL